MSTNAIVTGGIGLSAGFLISGAMFALITTLGIINRLAQDTHTARFSFRYEECVIWGGTLGNIVYIYQIIVPAGSVGIGVFGLAAGIYAGCLAIALAEILKTIPVFMMRSRLKSGLGWIVLAMAIGKSVGGIIYFFVFYH